MSSTQRPAWWPTEESKRHADAGCAHPDECKVDKPSTGVRYIVTDAHVARHSFPPGMSVRYTGRDNGTREVPAHRWLFRGAGMVQWLAAEDVSS